MPGPPPRSHAARKPDAEMGKDGMGRGGGDPAEMGADERSLYLGRIRSDFVLDSRISPSKDRPLSRPPLVMRRLHQRSAARKQGRRGLNLHIWRSKLRKLLTSKRKKEMSVAAWKADRIFTFVFIGINGRERQPQIIIIIRQYFSEIISNSRIINLDMIVLQSGGAYNIDNEAGR